MIESPLTETEVDQFIEDGYLHLGAVVPKEVVAAGQEIIWSDLKKSPDDPASWTEPVARVFPSDARPFAAAFDNPRLSGAFDQLVGPGRWQPRSHLGLFVVRFPHRADPTDTGWHVDESFPPDGYLSEAFDFSHWQVNILCRERALLMLFFFSDVGPDDAPTRLRVGSHLDVPALLRPAGSTGMSFSRATALAAKASQSRPVTFATGRAGDVYLCHPFLVHGVQSVRGGNPRLMSQTPLLSKEPVIPRPAGRERLARRGCHTPRLGRRGPTRGQLDRGATGHASSLTCPIAVVAVRVDASPVASRARSRALRPNSPRSEPAGAWPLRPGRHPEIPDMGSEPAESSGRVSQRRRLAMSSRLRPARTAGSTTSGKRWVNSVTRWS